MNTQPFEFYEQLKVGELGENDFRNYYPQLQPHKPKDFAKDFILYDGSSLELKTDTYDTHSSDSFALERWCGEKPGGPWRALQDRIDYFCYYFKRHSVFFWFNSQAICERANDYIRRFDPRLIHIPNRYNDSRQTGYDAQIYLIPRSYFKDIILAEHKFRK